jgi:hypothetical protein
MANPKDPNAKKPHRYPRPNPTAAKQGTRPRRKPKSGEGYVPRGKLKHD